MGPQPDENSERRASAAPRAGLCVASLDGTIRHIDEAFRQLWAGEFDGDAPAHLDQLLPGWQQGVDGACPLLELILRDGRPMPVWWSATVCGDDLIGTVHPQTAGPPPAGTPRPVTASTARLSHDLRLPLTGLVNGLQLSLSEVDAEAARRHVAMAYRSATYLQEMLDDLVDVGKLVEGRQPLRRQPFAVERLVQTVADTFRSIAEAKQLRIAAAVGGAVPPEVVGDSIRIQRVLHNLVHNAVTFTERGQVDITVTAIGGSRRRATLVFRVHDTGPGLSRANRGGLGLSIARELVGALGGSFSIQRNSRQGTHLQFTVPVRVATAADARTLDAPPPDPQRSLRCLVVEDTPSNAVVLQQLLEREGHRVSWAATSREAQRLCRVGAFDVAMVDLGLPDGDGADLIEVLRDAGAIPYCVAVTAQVLSNFRTRCLDAGFDGYLTKPIDRRELQWHLHAAEMLLEPSGDDASPTDAGPVAGPPGAETGNAADEP